MTTDPDHLTPPEHRCERTKGWKLVDRVKADPCACCTRRLSGWGLNGCGLHPTRTFPACVDQTPGFTPDYAVLYGKGAVE